MDHVDYTAWADYISMIFKNYGSGICDIVDCGCGTGTLLEKLSALGYTVAGFDRCFNMVENAKIKSRGRLWQGDLTSLPLHKEWDACISIYDTIQYLDLQQIKIFMQEVSRIVAQGGLLIFDIATKKNIEKYWSDFSDREKIRGSEITRKSWYDRKQEILHTCIQCSPNSDVHTTEEHHQQYIYDLEKYKNSVNEKYWKCLGCFHEFTFEPAHKNSERVHFIFRKEEL